MWLRWLPWRYVLSRLARSRGFIDPVSVLSRLHSFAQPSEVMEPIELLRAGVVLHARGLINSRAIQHNLDWVWPYWVERQFDPHDESFVPRAFSLTHINLTHRNWTAVGWPDCDHLPIIDPHGLVTPHWDGWSVDAWIVKPGSDALLPSRHHDVAQRLLLDGPTAVKTNVRAPGKSLIGDVDVVWEEYRPYCRIRLEASSALDGFLAVALRPANPEGVSFIHRIKWDKGTRHFSVDDHGQLHLDLDPDYVLMSDYREGDVFQQLEDHEERQLAESAEVTCDVGMATAVALYRLQAGGSSSSDGDAHRYAASVDARVPLSEKQAVQSASQLPTARHWFFGSHQDSDSGRDRCVLKTPDDHINFLFEASITSLLLHSPGDVYPGPYTYKRFWFRDSAFIIHALLLAGFDQRARRAIDRFPERQNVFGYFRSQDGEWDSNGEAIWIMDRWQQLSGEPLSAQLVKSVASGAHWIERKLTATGQGELHDGLMPAGFSAEHLGPNDFYYWDDFWSVAGLQSAARILQAADDCKNADRALKAADSLRESIDRSLEKSRSRRGRPGVPASPYRRMDAGAIGSLAVGYPLALWNSDDPRLMGTVEFLLEHCLVRGGFFQDMIHSGINPYLTLHLAQVLLRAADSRQVDLVRAVAELASPTGQWPEAIHPHTGGGCMGDGQHVWASAEWVAMMRNWFVREEQDELILGSGLPVEWLKAGHVLQCGPTLTPFGPIAVELSCGQDAIHVKWDSTWRHPPAKMQVRLAGRDVITADPNASEVLVPTQVSSCNLQ